MSAATLDAAAIAAGLDTDGYAVLPGLVDPAGCARLAALWEAPGAFRKHVDMAQHRFGQGVYRYFAAPLPSEVDALRHRLYPLLAPIARRWAPLIGITHDIPAELDDFLAFAHERGQRRPTPLLLRYGPGDYNCLHQDLYGPVVFPLQATVLLSEPGTDFTGGEFVLVEQRPRAQSRPIVVPLRRGDAVVFGTRTRPVAGTRGTYRVALRHGVSRIHEGFRTTLGLIFHDAT